MKITLEIFQILLSVVLISLIFLQATGENENRSNLLATASQKRGWDKIIFNTTIFCLVLFVATSILQTVLN